MSMELRNKLKKVICDNGKFSEHCLSECFSGDFCLKTINNILRTISESLPKEREVSEHEKHEFDSNYCYDCQEIVKFQDEPLIGNSFYNKCLSEIKELLK